MRESDVQKPPGIAEAIDWLAALSLLNVERLDAAAVDRTLGAVLKYEEDQEVVRSAGLGDWCGESPSSSSRSGRRLRRRGPAVTPEPARATSRSPSTSSSRSRGSACTGPRAACS